MEFALFMTGLYNLKGDKFCAVIFFYLPYLHPKIKPFVRLRNQATGEMSSLNFFILDKHLKEGRHFFVLGFPMASLQPGKYVLDFLAEERTTGARSTTHSAFLVK